MTLTVVNGTANVSTEHSLSSKGATNQHKSFEQSSYLPHNHPPPYGGPTNSQAIPSVNSSSTRDTFFVFLTLTFISITLYFTFFLWRKHRQRPLGTIYKLEEYRYSRLSQNELEVDSVVIYGDALQPEISQNNSEEDEDVTNKPATLHVETDSLITMSNCKSNGPLSNNVQSPKIKPPSIILQDSDEDLLQ